MSLMGEESPVWHSASFDILGPFVLKQFNKARGKGSTYKAYGLTATDLATGVTEVMLMQGCSKDDVLAGINMLANRYRLPNRFVCDAGAQLRTLKDNPILDAVSHAGLQVCPVPQGHQFLNWTERQIGVLKKLMKSLSNDANKSMYDQNDTLVTLQEKLLICFKSMNLRTILNKSKDGLENTIIAQQLLHPTLTRNDVHKFMNQLLDGKQQLENQLHLALLEYNKAILNDFHQLLLSYLQDSSVYYRDTRVGNDKKQRQSGLLPMKNDFVVFKASDNKLKFGLIEDTKLGSNEGVVVIRSLKYGKVHESRVHSRILKLVYRPSDEDCPLNT